MPEATLKLRTWACPDLEPRTPAVIRVLPVGGRVGIGVAIPGRSDLVGGTASPAEILEFARELILIATAAAEARA